MHDERRAWFWERVDKTGECWLWMRARDGKGYGQTQFGRASKVMRTHRIAYELTYGPIPPGLLVCHRCDNPPCCRPDHLFLGDKRANALDCVAKGRWRGGGIAGQFKAGSKHPQAKLTEEQVLEIRRRLTTGERTTRVARDFGVHINTIDRIRAGTTWRTILDGPVPGRTMHGSSHHAAKLTDADILAIRRRLSQGERGPDLAREYGVTGSTIWRIKVRRGWRHL